MNSMCDQLQKLNKAGAVRGAVLVTTALVEV